MPGDLGGIWSMTRSAIISARVEPEFVALVELPTSFGPQPDAMRIQHSTSHRLHV